MGPKKPRRTNLNEVLKEYQMFNQLNEEVHERPESHNNICLETCFTTFPDQPYTVPIITTEPVLETTNFRHKPNLAILDKNKNLDLLNTRHFSPKPLSDVAPLAQPEIFSDTSSSTSSTNNLDNITCSSTWARQIDNAPSPSILKAPQMMRRTPKIIGSLSTCTEDIRNVKSFEKLIKTGNALLDNSNSSSNLSYASGGSSKTNCSNDYEHFVSIGQCSWQREKEQNVKDWQIENKASKNSILAEELLEEILEYADCADFFKSDSSFLDGYDERLFDTESDTNCDTENGFKIPKIKLTKSSNTSGHSPLILSPCSLEIDPDVISNFAIDLNLEQEHRSLLSQQNLQTSILKVSHIGGYNNGSHTPPCAKTVTFSPDVLSIDDRSLLQGSSEYLPTRAGRSGIWNFIPFKYFSKKIRETTTSLPNLPKTENVSTISSETDKKRSIDQLLTRNEALPLLNAAKSDSSEHFYSTVFHKRKVCVNSEV